MAIKYYDESGTEQTSTATILDVVGADAIHHLFPMSAELHLTMNAQTISSGAVPTLTVPSALSGKTVTWSATGSISINSSTGAVTGADGASGTVTATVAGISASATITIGTGSGGGGEDDPGAGTQTLPNFGTVAMPPESAQLIGTSTVTFTTAWVSGAINMRESVGNTLVFTFGNEIDISTVKYIRMTSDFSGVDLDAISTAFIAVGALTVNGQLGFDQEMTAGDGQTLFGTGGNASGIGWGHVNSGGQWTNQAQTGQEAEIKVTVSGSTLTQIHLRIGNPYHYLCNGQKITFELYGDETA